MQDGGADARVHRSDAWRGQMTASDFYIERVWIAVPPQHEEFVLSIRVTFPVLQSGGEWMSLVSLGNVKHGTDDIHGGDSWQAMELAMRHAAARWPLGVRCSSSR